MRLFSLLPVFGLPAISFAFPNADAGAEPNVIPRAPVALPDSEVYDLLSRDLIARQLDLSNLTSLLGSLSGTITGVEQLLSSNSLNNIESVVNNLAYLLAEPTTNQTKSLIDTASNLLSGSLFSQVEALLTPQTVTDIGNLLTNANNLLTPTFVNETVTLIGDVAPVSDELMIRNQMVNTIQLVSAVTQIISVLISSILGVST
jgi:hypothetical protein